jgi:hypothetical protein
MHGQKLMQQKSSQAKAEALSKCGADQMNTDPNAIYRRDENSS